MIFCGSLHLSPAHLKLRKQTLPGPKEKVRLFSASIRTSLHFLCQYLKLNSQSEILVPAYNCGTEIDPFIQFGAKVIPYKINRECSIDFKDLESKITDQTKILYVTPFHGFPEGMEKARLLASSKNILLIEDCALAFFRSHEYAADISLFSLPKFFPVADGGILEIGKGDFPDMTWPERSIAFQHQIQSLSMVLRTLLSNGAGAFRKSPERVQTPQGELRKLPENYYFNNQLINRNMSSLSRGILEHLDFSAIALRRRENYRKLFAHLKNNQSIKLLYGDLPEKVVPLHLPFLTEERDRLNRELNKRKIRSKCWWAGFHRAVNWSQFPDAVYLKNHLISLPVHQNLTERHMAYIGETVNAVTGQC